MWIYLSVKGLILPKGFPTFIALLGSLQCDLGQTMLVPTAKHLPTFITFVRLFSSKNFLMFSQGGSMAKVYYD